MSATHKLQFTTRLLKEGSTLAVGVKVRNNEDIDRALKRFRRQVNRSRVLQEYRQNMAYMKPSEEKRLKKKKARRRRHRERKRGNNRKRR
jgi:small subunit ribosomal protein S21